MDSKKLLITTVASLILTSCDPDEYSQKTLKEFGIKAATSYITYSVQESYLACYALNVNAKAKCVNSLHDKHILKRWRAKEAYTSNFQYTAEKLGFKSFLEQKNLSCESINKSPIFSLEHRAYAVKCIPRNTYFMQFNYKTKKWSIVKYY